MKQGKNTCKILKEIRRQIAEANDIEFITSECRYQGDCLGTCPKCEAEVRYLEQQLEKKRLAGKAATIIGVSMGITSLATPVQAVAQTINPPTEISDTIKNVKEKEVIKNSEDYSPEVDGEIIFGPIIETMPSFPGGNAECMKFIEQNLRYPEEARNKRIEGRVIMLFIIDKNGSVTEPYVAKGVEKSLDEEAIRLIKSMPKWIPAKMDGKPIQIKYALPIQFKLSPKAPIIMGESEALSKKDTVYTTVDKMPSFPGGDTECKKHIDKEIRANKKVREYGISGELELQFIVEKDGSLSEIIVSKSATPYLDKAAIEAVTYMPKWIPGKLNGEAVRVKYTLPVSFRLE